MKKLILALVAALCIGLAAYWGYVQMPVPIGDEVNIKDPYWGVDTIDTAILNSGLIVRAEYVEPSLVGSLSFDVKSVIKGKCKDKRIDVFVDGNNDTGKVIEYTVGDTYLLMLKQYFVPTSGVAGQYKVTSVDSIFNVSRMRAAAVTERGAEYIGDLGKFSGQLVRGVARNRNTKIIGVEAFSVMSDYFNAGAVKVLMEKTLTDASTIKVSEIKLQDFSYVWATGKRPADADPKDDFIIGIVYFTPKENVKGDMAKGKYGIMLRFPNMETVERYKTEEMVAVTNKDDKSITSGLIMTKAEYDRIR